MVVITGMDGSVVTTDAVNQISNAIAPRGSQLVSGPSTITMTSIGSNGIPTVFVVTQVATLGINSGGGPTLAPNESSGERNGSTSKPSSVATVGAAIGGVFGFAAFAAVAMVIVFRRRRRRMKKSEDSALYRRAALPDGTRPPPQPRDGPVVSTTQLEKQMIISRDDTHTPPDKPTDAGVSIYGSATRFERGVAVPPKVSKLGKETKAGLFNGIGVSRYAQEDVTTVKAPFEKNVIGFDVPFPGKEKSTIMPRMQQANAQGSSLMGRSQTSVTRQETDTAPPPYAAD
ncbi:hypothetical protein HDU67_000511 [Dinochytrium kinnereticum]|nr:hypothetical protein HDU67_000511 [Dinochytrium kinnereticum]